MSTAKGMFAGPKIVSICFYTGLFVVATAVALFTYYIDTRPYFTVPVSDPKALAAAFFKAADTYAGTVSLLTTLGTGVLASMGWFFTKRPKQGNTARDLWPAIAGVLCACLSIIFGYVASENLEWALEYSVGTLELLKLQLPRWFQFYTLLLSVFFFADFMRRDWTKVDLHEDSTNSST